MPRTSSTAKPNSDIMSKYTPPTTPRTARKGLPGAQTASKGLSGAQTLQTLKARKGQKSALDVEGPVDSLHAKPKTSSKKRKFQESVAAAPAAPEVQDLDNASDLSPEGPTPGPSKKQKVNTNLTRSGKTPGNQQKKAVRALKNDDDDRPSFKSTQKPNGTLISSVSFSKYSTITSWKISSDVSLPKSATLADQGNITSYNLTQMNWHWIKTLVKNLKDVAQIRCSVRGWKETLLYCLGEANIPDNGDLELEKKIADIEKKRKRGALMDTEAERELEALETELEKWEPRWHNEPLYDLTIMNGMFEDPNIMVVKLMSTHGELFIRTDSEFEPWRDFVEWLDVKQSNMRGYKSRRYGTEWNGFEITEQPISEDPGLAARVAEIESLFQKHGCVAIWRTEEHFDGVLSR